MKSSIKIIFVLFFFFINFIGCESPNSCDSGGQNPLPYFDITGLKITNLKDSGLPALSGEEVGIIKYNLVLSLEATYYSSLKCSGFTAIACSPIENGYMGSKEKIDYIKVSCDKDFDDKHPANSSLNDLTLVGFYYSGKAPTQTLDGKIKENNFTPKSKSEFWLTFSTPPSKKQSLTFTVEYALTNGEKYTAKTLPVIIY
jgi:hypothetical protein